MTNQTYAKKRPLLTLIKLQRLKIEQLEAKLNGNSGIGESRILHNAIAEALGLAIDMNSGETPIESISDTRSEVDYRHYQPSGERYALKG